MEKAVRFLGVCILLSAIIISALFIYKNLPNRYKIMGDEVFDTYKGVYVTHPTTQSKYAEERERIKQESNQYKGDFSKVIVLESKGEKSDLFFSATCRVQNNDTVVHIVGIKATFYDKNKSPLLTNKSKGVQLEPGDIKVLSLTEVNKNNTIDSCDISLIDLRPSWEQE